ncbi:MAG: WYL domain-containing protein [Actinobacteria bacterium]|nr:WYL domain-containing protein [Actinomycetota bacterium]
MAGKKLTVTATERILNLVALLSESNAPLTFEDIVVKMRGQYSENSEARRTTFERDKKSLRKLGVPLTTRTLAGADAGKTAYSIDRSGYALIDFGLTHEEMAALQQAAAMVQIGTSWGKQAVQWLGGEITSAEAPTAVNVSVGSHMLPTVWEAVSLSRPLTFQYRGKSRLVHPYGLLARNGFWYLIGHDTTRDAQVTFRIDRIEGDVKAGESNSFARPEDFDLATAYMRDAKEFSDGGNEMAIVRVDHRVAPAVLRELGDEAIVARRSDGSVDVEVACGNTTAFESWLFAMVDRAEVISPADVRARVIGRLQEMAGSNS